MPHHLHLTEKEKRILRYIYCFGDTTRQQLAIRSRYTSPTVYRLIEDLMRKQLVVVSGVTEELGKGRPTERVAIHGAQGWVFCLHTTREGYNTAVVDLAGRMLEMRQHPFPGATEPAQVVEQAFLDYQEMAASHGLSPDGMMGVGLAMVGPVDYQRGWMKGPIYFAGGDWRDVPIVAMLEKKFDAPVTYDCNAGACVMGHYLPEYYGVYANMAYVTMSKGIGSGLVLNESLHVNRRGFQDALAHMVIELNGRKCTCGAYGCVEAYASQNAILQECARQLKAGRRSVMDPYTDTLEIRHVAQALTQKDAIAEYVVQEAATMMACCLSNYLRIVFLDVVVIGGSLIEELPQFFGYIQEALARKGESQIVLLQGKDESENVVKGIASQVLLAGLLK